MALRIRWDEQETALLIDAYLRVKNKELSWQEAVKEVSELLRRRAVLAGLTVDETFRSESGIGVQMRYIQIIMENRSGGKLAPLIFWEMAELYRTSKTEFRRILDQAKEECGIHVNVQELVWNFAEERIDFSTIRPIKVSYFGEEKECDGWQSLWVQSIRFLEEDYPEIIRGMIGHCFAAVDKVLLSTGADLDGFGKAVELQDGFYLETDVTPDQIVTLIRLLMDRCNMDYDNLEITCQHGQALPVFGTAAIAETSFVALRVRERYTVILAEHFADGFRPEKALDRDRFRMYYSGRFGQELTEEDAQLVRSLKKVGTLRDGRIFVEDEAEQNDLLEEINDVVMKTFEAGASSIYMDCLFAKFQEKLAERLHIYNVDSLESVLLSSKKRNYFKKYKYLCQYNKEPEAYTDVIAYMKNMHLPVTHSEIAAGLWYFPFHKIKQILLAAPVIVSIAPETCLYAENLPVSEKEIGQIAELIHDALLQRSYISDVELMQLIEENCPSVIMNTLDYPIRGRRNALAYFLQDKFSFRGSIISEKDEEISMAEVFADFCKRSERVTVEELKNLAGELNTIIYWDSVYGEMVRINQKEFVRRDQIHFDVVQTDRVLDSLIQNAYAPIKNMNLFLHFPVIEVPWNSFVLESYAAKNSKRFRLLHASGYSAAESCGAIVRRESGISNYSTLAADVLAKNQGWKNKEEALQILVDLGYQQRRSYKEIEKVMQEAKIRRNIQKK